MLGGTTPTCVLALMCVVVMRLVLLLCLCSRYDYEGVESEKADRVMNHVREVISKSPPGTKFGAFELQMAGEWREE